MSQKSIPALIRTAGAACAESLTLFYQAHPNALSIRDVMFDIDFDGFKLTVPDRNLKDMIEDHFDASAGLARQLGNISDDIRQQLPVLVRSLSVQILVEAYINESRGLHYKCEDTIASINGITAWRPEIALERLALLSGPYQRTESAPAVWMVLRLNNDIMKSTDERIVAGSLEEAVVTYACIGMGAQEHLAILNGDKEAIEQHFSHVSFVAEPVFTASDVLRESVRTYNIADPEPGL